MRCRCCTPPSFTCFRRASRPPAGNMALIAAGTGLGEAFLHFVDGRLIPSPCEGGHADFAARTERDITVLRALVQRISARQSNTSYRAPA